MVKPELDVSIDYYSLLNVSHRADAEEIKKSYYKLGMSSCASQQLT
jgi:curved DNA-binding protein CbpA